MWPGDGIDRCRFTEFLIRFSPSGTDVQRISIPVLVVKLKSRKFFAAAKVLMDNYPLSDFGEVITCDMIDQSEDSVVNLCPGIDTKVIRDASHVGIIYKDLRCGLVHEGHVSKSMFHDFPSEIEAPYYANILVDPDSPLEHPICFPYHYIRNILVTAVESAFSDRKAVRSWVMALPSKWWIEGK